MTFKQSASTGMLHVKRVKEGGAAERVDIRAGDVILSLDGQVTSPALSQLFCAHHFREPGIVFVIFSLDGQALQNMEKKALSRLMLGPPGSAVEVGMQRKDATRVDSLTLIRGDGAPKPSTLNHDPLSMVCPANLSTRNPPNPSTVVRDP